MASNGPASRKANELRGWERCFAACEKGNQRADFTLSSQATKRNCG